MKRAKNNLVGGSALSGLLVGLTLSACPNTYLSKDACTSLCQSAYACGVIPSALGSGIASDDEETVVASCVERCRSSKTGEGEVDGIIECLKMYDPVDAVDVCAPECNDVVTCMRSQVSTGSVGAESLGYSTVTVTMVPADFWLSTKENAAWCPEGLGDVPILNEYYRAEAIGPKMIDLFGKVDASYTSLINDLNEAADNAERLAALDTIESGIYVGDHVLPGSLIPILRAELAADGWAAKGVFDGDLTPGGCIRQLIDDSRDPRLEGVDITDPVAVGALLNAEVSGEDAFEVFSSGFNVCQANSDYVGAMGAKQCAQAVNAESDTCRVFGKPMCKVGDCDGGLAGCDPLMCFFEQLPPSRACSDLGVDEVYLGYERDGTKYTSQVARTCDGTVMQSSFPGVAVSVVTPFAVVRGTLNGGVPGTEPLRCGTSAGAPAPRPGRGPHDQVAAQVDAPAALPRNADTADPFAEVGPGEYCWVVHGSPTQVVAGARDLVVPSPFVEFLREAIKPGARFGLLAPQRPIGCGCERDDDNCESLENGNCRDGIDNDGDGLADYYAPECAGYVEEIPYYDAPSEVDASEIDACGALLDGE